MYLALLSAFLAHPGHYDHARQSSLVTNQPLVIYISCPPLGVGNTIEHYEAKGFAWHRTPAILIGIPRGDWLEWTETLGATAAPQEVSDAILRTQTQATPVPPLFTESGVVLKVTPKRARFGLRRR